MLSAFSNPLCHSYIIKFIYSLNVLTIHPPHLTQNFISWYIILIQLIIVLLTPVFLILNHKASLLMESDAFLKYETHLSKSTKHQNNLLLFALKYIPTHILIQKILPSVFLPLVNTVWNKLSFLRCNNQSLSLHAIILEYTFPKLVLVKCLYSYQAPSCFPSLIHWLY